MLCCGADVQVMAVVTVNRVQDVCLNPIFKEIPLATLDGYFWKDDEFDIEIYQRGNFNSVHIGEFRLKEKEGRKE